MPAQQMVQDSVQGEPGALVIAHTYWQSRRHVPPDCSIVSREIECAAFRQAGELGVVGGAGTPAAVLLAEIHE